MKRATVPRESTHEGTCPCDRCNPEHVECPDCDGAGWITVTAPDRDPQLERECRCETCRGDGTVDEQTIADRADLPVSAADFADPRPDPDAPDLEVPF